jgi:hypothetical protein
MSPLICRNKNLEEVARIVFDDNGVRGWCIQSKAEPRFNRKFASQLEASIIWNAEFDPETGRLRQRSKAA